jgi:UDPglucose 6-dehydrogenase
MRDAPSLDIVPALIAAGAKIKAFDPEAMGEAKKLLDGIEYCDGAYDAISGADAMVVLTEWNEFRGMDLDRIKDALVHPTVVDLRNVYDPTEMAENGFSYSCVGRATIGG